MTFGYPGGRGRRTSSLSFTVRAGERVAIVGPSGSGKSTVARLLLRFHDPQSGRVLVGGRDVRDLPLADLRALVAVVHQDTYLFHGTVAENLRMGETGRDAVRARGGGAGSPRPRVHQRACRRATRPSSGSGACGYRAGSGSASPSPGRFCATRRS